MKKTLFLSFIIALTAIAYSCKKSANSTVGTTYLDLPATADVYSTFSTDPLFNQKATLGRVLFYDGHLSVNNAVSCGSCHKQALGFADNAALSMGYQGLPTKRNSKSLSNLNGDDPTNLAINTPGSPLFWDGREDILQNLIARPITNHAEMGIEDPNTLPAKLSVITFYNPLFANAYGDSSITTARISECISDFMVAIQSHNTRFDQYLQTGSTSSFSALEVTGMNLFLTKYNCGNCHHIFTSTYTDDDFHDIGLDINYADMGRGTITGNASDNGKFRVPSLRNVCLSAPYMHDGRFATLGDVIDHYSQNIQNSPNLDVQLTDSTGQAMKMNISSQEKTAIIAFLGTLTDYQLVTDPKFSNPFKTK